MPTNNGSPQPIPADSPQDPWAQYRAAAGYARYCLALALAAETGLNFVKIYNSLEAHTAARLVPPSGGSGGGWIKLVILTFIILLFIAICSFAIYGNIAERIACSRYADTHWTREVRYIPAMGCMENLNGQWKPVDLPVGY